MTHNARQFTVPQPINPPSPHHREDLGWITGYMVVHMMSDNSRVWAYIFWMAIILCIIIGTLAHRLGSSGGFLGAYWRRYTIPQRTWRWRGESLSLPSNAQFIFLGGLLLASSILSVAGTDYLTGQIRFFQLSRREEGASTLERRAKYYDPAQFAKNQPTYNIAKAFWTAGGRVGIMAFALTPLCILFALKASPISFTMQIHFDKVAFLHRWSGRLIWLVTAIHITLWTVQLSRDKRDSTGRTALHYAWMYDKFIYGWIAFALLTMLILLSLRALRKTHYDAFYFMHVLLAPLTMIMAAAHHPPMAYWMAIAGGLWLVERIYRGAWWLRMNGIVGGTAPRAAHIPNSSKARANAYEMAVQPPATPGAKTCRRVPPPLGQESLFESQNTSIPDPFRSPEIPAYAESQPLLPSSALSYTPPPGFTHAELLSGRTIRLTFVSPTFRAWAPGQYFLIGIPSVSMIATHPFTVASVCDQQAPTDAGRAIVLLVRCKVGWTKDLWDLVAGLIARQEPHPRGESLPAGAERPSHGVLLKMYIEGPFGSSERTRWSQHSSVVIYAGGSGISFGLSILEYVCLCMAGRDGIHLGGTSGKWGTKGYNTNRVRLVWLIREFSHIQWCAATVHRCMRLVPNDLQIDIFVTNSTPNVPRGRGLKPPRPQFVPSSLASNVLVPPEPGFARSSSRAKSVSSIGSEDESSDGDDSVTDHVLGEYEDQYGNDDSGDIGTNRNYLLDLTNWDGDNDEQLPGEDHLNRTVQKAGRRSRAFKTKIAAKRTSGHGIRLVPQGPGNHYQDVNSLDGPTDGLTRAPFAPSPLSPMRSPPHSAVSLMRPDSPHGSFMSERGLLPRETTPEDRIRLDVEDREMRDMNAVAVNARPGKPRLDKILADEVERSKGSVVVACCGPSSLSAMIRRAVAAQINPGRIRKGDLRGDVILVAEDYQY